MQSAKSYTFESTSSSEQTGIPKAVVFEYKGKRKILRKPVTHEDATIAARRHFTSIPPRGNLHFYTDELNYSESGESAEITPEVWADLIHHLRKPIVVREVIRSVLKGPPKPITIPSVSFLIPETPPLDEDSPDGGGAAAADEEDEPQTAIPTAITPVPAAKITVYVEDFSRIILASFRLYPTTPIGKLIAAFSLQFDVPVDRVRMIWNGFRISPEKTPAVLGFEDGSRIVFYPKAIDEPRFSLEATPPLTPISRRISIDQ